MGVVVLVAIVCLAGLAGLYFLLRPKSEPSPTSTPKPEAATIKPLTPPPPVLTPVLERNHSPAIDHGASSGAAQEAGH